MPIANLTPFVTALPDIQILKTTADDELCMSIVSVPDAVIYHDVKNNHKVTAPVWTYEQTIEPKLPSQAWIGPIITAKTGHKLQVEWLNNISEIETNPIHKAVEKTPQTGAAPNIPQNILGAATSVRSPARPYFATHMHGGRTAPNYDGWPESMMRPASATHAAQSRRIRYDNDERASMLWYHDHAMHATAINVFAGLAGGYVITDAEEEQLQSQFNFPKGGDEIVMILRDCNLTLDPTISLAKGTTSTQFLHKTEDGVIEQFGPINMVNGVIWPQRDVDPGLYRLRILNGANSRTYALQFVNENTDGTWTKLDVPVHQIGSDGGLMTAPRDRTGEAIVMMPAERLDLLVDFTNFATQNILLVNIAAAPFGGDGSLIPLAELPPANPDCDLEDPSAPYDPDLNGPRRNPYPQIMRFDVKKKANKHHPNSKDLHQILPAMPAIVTAPNPLDKLPPAPTVRTIALLEKDMGVHMGMAMGPMLTTMELVPEARLASFTPPAAGGAVNLAVGEAPFQALHAARRIIIDGVAHRLVAERFQDAVNFVVPYGATEIWRFINLSPDSHPMHMHLVQYRQKSSSHISSVNATVPDPNIVGATMLLDTASGIAAEDVINSAFTSHPSSDVGITTGGSTATPLETGLKDTIRVDPLTIVEIAATFDGYMGRYLYHCHLLEHEDHDMMRQFVVTRDDMMALMPHHMGQMYTSMGK